MELRTGYRSTELGLLPMEWQVEPLGKHASFRTGPFGSALHKSDYIRDGVPVINPMHIVDGDILPSDTVTITQEAARNLAEFRLQPGEIVIGRRGDMGRCAVVRKQHAGYLCGTGSMIVRPLDIQPDFLQRLLSSHQAITAIKSASVGTTMVNLNQGTLSGLKIPYPPKAEQRAIAATLSDVDALIGALDKLIAKKRDLKQAAMQQLLTGQTRLPRFSGEWEVKKLACIGDFLKGRGVTRDQARSGDLPCVRYGEIYTTHADIIRAFTSWISREVAASAIKLKRGDILFAGSGETKEEIGKCVAFVNDREAYAGGDIVILRPRSADSTFLGYALNTPAVSRQKAHRGQGDSVVHISAAALSEIEVAVPSIAEQTAIATVLLDMDAELTALQARRDKTRALKKGMMQELLTGRIRFPM